MSFLTALSIWLFFESLGCRTCKRVSWRCCFVFSKNWATCQVLPASLYLPCACTCDPATSLASTLAITQAARPGSSSGRKCYTPPSHPPQKIKVFRCRSLCKRDTNVLSLLPSLPVNLKIWGSGFFALSELIRSTVIHIFIWTSSNFFSCNLDVYLFSHLKMPYFHSASSQAGYLLCEISQDWAAVQIRCVYGVSPRQPSASDPWKSAPSAAVLSAPTLYKYCMKTVI